MGDDGCAEFPHRESHPGVAHIANQPNRQKTTVPRSDRRTSGRRKVLWVGCLDFRAGRFECEILDISVGGALVRLDDAKACPDARCVMLRIPPLGDIPAATVWRRDDVIGLRFRLVPEGLKRIIETATGRVAGNP